MRATDYNTSKICHINDISLHWPGFKIFFRNLRTNERGYGEIVTVGFLPRQFLCSYLQITVVTAKMALVTENLFLTNVSVL